jgi:hypothetical protein
MKQKDIIGKEFICFKFELPDKLIQWDGQYESTLGKTATVIEINSSHPQYAYAKINVGIGKTRSLHFFPTQMIIDQIEYDNKSINDILNDMKQLISTI